MLLELAYTWRGLLVSLPVLFAVVCFWAECENAVLVWPPGLLLFLSGWVLRIWAQQHVCYRLKTRKTLTTYGPYAIVCNPIYIGNTLIVLGIVVLAELIWLLPITMLWCMGVYVLVVRYEERLLQQKYGAAYCTYQAAVSRWLPCVTRGWMVRCRRAYLRQALRVG